MSQGRSVSEMLGLGSPPFEMGHSFTPGVRHTPGYQPTPNSEPLGSETGAPPRPRFYSVAILPGGAPTLIAPDTRDNRIVTIVPPSVGFTVFIGDTGVSANNGYAMQAGVSDDFPLVGFQGLYAVTNAPVVLRLQVKIFSILLAERERRL